MRILCSNDDGIHAPGIHILETIAKSISEDVWLVAPEMDQSGVSHALSLNDPLRLRKLDDKKYGVRGTPTDCVVMGVRHVLQSQKPDLVLSGVNRGQNLGEDVRYSGTIAAAMEATIMGIPAIAFSQAYGEQGRSSINWEGCLKYGPDIIQKILKFGIPKNTLMNVNFPNCSPSEIRGIKASKQGRRSENMIHLDHRVDGRENDYFWLVFDRVAEIPCEDTDLWAIDNNWISITPIQLDMTNYKILEKLKKVI